MDNNQQDKKLQQLQQQLSKSLAAERFFDLESGRLIEELLTQRVNNSIRQLTSDKFLKDHQGFIAENAWLRANKRLLEELKVLASPAYKGKLQDTIEEFSDGSE